MSECTETKDYKLLFSNNKIYNFEQTLQKSLDDFKDLKLEFEKICAESVDNKNKFLAQREKCDNKNCYSAELLSKEIETKDNILQSVASHLTNLRETKNFAILEDIFKIICKDISFKQSPGNNLEDVSIKKEDESSDELMSVKKEESSYDSESEIDGTPTGRTSPIIQMKDKKKCPDDWPTPQKKTLKLQYPASLKKKGNGKLRQSRLTYVIAKQSNVVDLTCSPDFGGGLRHSRSETNITPLQVRASSVDYDETIMPSPTSVPNNFTPMKSTKTSPRKFKKPLSLKVKKDKENYAKLKLIPSEEERRKEREDPINVLCQASGRLNNDLSNDHILKNAVDNDVTRCDNSISILQQCSPNKVPLEENLNTVNVPTNDDMESSISLLRSDTRSYKMSDIELVKRKIPEFAEPVYKETTVRKKSEKRALPGWICEECKNFYGKLYEDDPLMLAKMIEECSKHRGKRNPSRPKTPPNFWNPRWEVPQDTDELNRLNNAV